MKSLPSRWSVSCWMARLSRSSASSSIALPCEVEGLDLDLPRPADLGVEAGEAQAALLVLDRRVPLDDLGVDEDLLLVLLLGVGRQVQDEEPVRQGDLVGRQADPPRLVHQVEHRADRRPQLVVDLGRRAATRSEGRDGDRARSAARELSGTWVDRVSVAIVKQRRPPMPRRPRRDGRASASPAAWAVGSARGRRRPRAARRAAGRVRTRSFQAPAGEEEDRARRRRPRSWRRTSLGRRLSPSRSVAARPLAGDRRPRWPAAGRVRPSRPGIGPAYWRNRGVFRSASAGDQRVDPREVEARRRRSPARPPSRPRPPGAGPAA